MNYEKYVIKKLLKIAKEKPFAICEILRLTDRLCDIALSRGLDLIFIDIENQETE